MIDNTGLYKILDKKDPTEVEKVKVLIRYIFDNKQEDMSEIPIKYPEDHRQHLLMNAMYNIAKQHYLNGL